MVKDYGAVNLPVNQEPPWEWDSSRACQPSDKLLRVLSELEAAEAQVVSSKVLASNKIHLEEEALVPLVNSRRSSQALTNLKNLLYLAVSRPRKVYSSQAHLDKIRARG